MRGCTWLHHGSSSCVHMCIHVHTKPQSYNTYKRYTHMHIEQIPQTYIPSHKPPNPSHTCTHTHSHPPLTHSTGQFALGVADGIYSWRTKGIDSGEYSRGLLQHVKTLVEEGHTDVLSSMCWVGG